MSSYYNNNKPFCFGDNVYYNETSNQCRGCGFRQACANYIEKGAKEEVSANPTTNYYRPRASSPTSNTNQTTTAVSPNSSSTPTYATNNYSSSNNTNRPVVMRDNRGDFNFERDDLGRQFTTYLMYDMAEVATERLHSFIVASKEDYRQSLRKK